MSPRLQVSIEKEEVFAAVVKMAGEETRSLSSMAAILIERGLKAQSPEDAQLLAAVSEVGGATIASEVLLRHIRTKKRAA